MECSLDPELYQQHRLTAEEREQFRTEVSNHASHPSLEPRARLTAR